MKIEKILEERASRYGEFEDVAEYSQKLKGMWYDSIKSTDKITDPMNEAMEMLLHKLARIFSGDKTYKDSFVDLIGYAELYLKELDKDEDKCEDLDKSIKSDVNIFEKDDVSNQINKALQNNKEIQKMINELQEKYNFM